MLRDLMNGTMADGRFQPENRRKHPPAAVEPRRVAGGVVSLKPTGLTDDVGRGTINRTDGADDVLEVHVTVLRPRRTSAFCATSAWRALTADGQPWRGRESWPCVSLRELAGVTDADVAGMRSLCEKAGVVAVAYSAVVRSSRARGLVGVFANHLCESRVFVIVGGSLTSDQSRNRQDASSGKSNKLVHLISITNSGSIRIRPRGFGFPLFNRALRSARLNGGAGERFRCSVRRVAGLDVVA